MAITRAQQAKQMLAQGGRIGLKGGADAATASFGKSVGYSGPSGTTGRPDKDFNPGTGGGGPTFGDAQATTVTGGDVRKAKEKYEKQFFDKGQVPPLGSRPKSFKTKLNQFNLQKRLNYINRLIDQRRNKIAKGLVDYQDEEGQIQGLTDFDTLESYIDKVQSVKDLVDKGFYKPDGQFATGQKIPDFPSTELPGMLGLAQDIFGGPVTSDKLNQLNEQIKDLEALKTTEGLEGTDFNKLMETYEPNRFKLNNPETGGDNRSNEDPCKGPNPPAYCFANRDPDPDPATPAFAPNFRLLAEGGMAEKAPYEGGIMDLESARQMYGLGKLVKKVTRTVKKIAKSPIGKAAIGAALFKFGGGGKGIGKFLFGTKARNQALLGKEGFLGSLGLTKGFGSYMPTALGGIAASTLGSYFLTPKEEDDEELYAGADIADPRFIMANPERFQNIRTMAEGGSTEKEPVAKKTMPLLDMGGKEMDLREEGGFVPIGRMEKADDVPARLSKNEFVFTADAVRNAGDGNVDKGAEVMYNMMKNLEAGGEVSEESQGLEGARKMFQTSQRLEEVL